MTEKEEVIQIVDEERPGAITRHGRDGDEEENEKLLEVFGKIPMKGDLIITTERAPDFFALYRQQKAKTECWVYEYEDQILGLGSIIYREGYMFGEPCRVAYLGDLRAAKEVRGTLPRVYGKVFDNFQERIGVDHFYTGILASNKQAIAALTKRSDKRSEQPHYDLFRTYQAVQVQFAGRPKKPSTSGFEVRRATMEELPAIITHLHEDHRQRPFGYRYDQGEFEHRLEHWPGFVIENTYLCVDTSNGDIVGLCTAWDAEEVKRYRVLAWRGKMRVVKLGFNMVAKLLGHTPLPNAGDIFRYFYLANLSIPSNDPNVLRALIDKIYADFHGRGYHFFMIYMEDDNPMNAAFEGLTTRNLPFHLYSVRPAGSEQTVYPAGTSGFEIALA